MLQLIDHIVRISARRDRTEINAAMVDAVRELFHPRKLKLHRCLVGSKGTMLFDCAGADTGGRYLRNAYHPEQRHCQPLERDSLHLKCWQAMSPVMEHGGDGTQRIVFPVYRDDRPAYLIDLELAEECAADSRVALMGLIEYFGNHIALLDYGEEDTLTGLASRKTFDKHLFELLGQAATDERNTHGRPHRRHGRAGASHWLAVCDLDRFKEINDTFGHLIGDEVLIMLAQVMREAFRFDDQLFRFGGEEFVALLQPTDQRSALQALERFRKDVEGQVFSRVGHVTISIGVSALLPHDTPTDVIDRADEALYYAKRNGRNRIDCYEHLVAQGLLAAKNIAKGEVELF